MGFVSQAAVYNGLGLRNLDGHNLCATVCFVAGTILLALALRACDGRVEKPPIPTVKNKPRPVRIQR